ncbi:8417_t:CDS:2 [Entrophospora sp. SA101]|nr:8417_t:CDS:2 [Entrophospora sp. SA101]
MSSWIPHLIQVFGHVYMDFDIEDILNMLKKQANNAKQFDGIKFYYETQNLFRNSNSTSSHSSSSHSHSSSFSSGRSNNSNHNKNSNAHKYNYNPSQLSAIQQQQILKNHLDCITDLAITEFPHPMLISGDRDGILKVFL